MVIIFYRFTCFHETVFVTFPLKLIECLLFPVQGFLLRSERCRNVQECSRVFRNIQEYQSQENLIPKRFISEASTSEDLILENLASKDLTSEDQKIDI